jgi:hypothetical protein
MVSSKHSGKREQIASGKIIGPDLILAEAVVPQDRAAEAIAKNPKKSNVAIALELGVDEKTVRKMRPPTSDKSEVRVGRDGKVRRMPTPSPWKRPATTRSIAHRASPGARHRGSRADKRPERQSRPRRPCAQWAPRVGE